MNYNQALNVFSEMREGFKLKDADPEKIIEVFSAFSRWESHLIQNRVGHLINQNEFLSGLEDIEQAEMEVFSCCFVDLIQSHFTKANNPVDHDAESWIEDVSPIVTEGLICKMESYIDKEPAEFRDRLDFYKKIDFDECVAIVSRDLNECLSVAKKSLEERVQSEDCLACHS
ncbi:hypothetical protein Q9L42_020805 (plasmid) [Methylomarinum sp. Ch1-1]|uniref:Uncharacterized protein n=1 Tax=Methylomarinum roseum TaxID=3067653 RepID=A0AAU7P0H5_9GAMM|nr:hypothetical protein [Methylomarinum sp. Ch1-1]MDP4518962.1 hypothetical protein [Methylomarinum sp. Ch1-1]MDP4523360.1 hypothetical protein [Methylomarinum sp. Ch1-1]